jgi:hypothetical protein
MHPAISYELATARIADLRRQSQHEALAGAAAPVPSSASQPARNRIPVTVTSPDGTPIAYDRAGTGAPLVLAGGTFSYRRGEFAAAGVHSGAARSRQQ